MDDTVKNEIAALARRAHDLTESAYQLDPATRDGTGWADKQRILLADMALHLLQTSLKDGELSVDDLTRNLYAILTVSEQFLPGRGLKGQAERLY